ncbi:hypothetical protein PM10SUCC1_32980 [Propionigenium maris DSM 9537]|uniref:Uncharacterized protein n=1 Tax=Propionigenium maris DSM 9537 TaxID=1123000 RepID=A0A9W6LPA1_9FUSO|nr:hypothetical protein [Propionigenium maris]GLI57784.1 hypothetical protein PM10SUCC1_32980 [Propionigenium maris DSM 9537]
MRKKIKMPVPKIINEVLEKDCHHFGITKEKLCNEVILKMGYKPLIKYHKMMTFEEKVDLQFNLQVETQKYYKDIWKENNATSDAELVRTILSTYINLSPFLREKIIMDTKLRFILELLREKHIVKIEVDGKIIEAELMEILRCSETNYLKVIHSQGEEYLSKLEIIRK